MSEFLLENDYSEYEDFLKRNSYSHLFQTPVWAMVKKNWQSDIIVSRDDHGVIHAGVLVLHRKLPFVPYSILYAPRGPVMDENEYHHMKDLADGIQTLAKKTNAYIFKADPAISNNKLSFWEHVLFAGFQIYDTGQNFDGIQPKHVMRLILKNKTAEQIYKDFKPKTRYNIRLAIRKGVKIRVGGKQDISTFYSLMEITGKRDGFHIRPYQYFIQMFEVLHPNYLRLFLAEWDGKVIAASLVGIFGNKAWYLYGASDDQHRNVMPNYLMQWEIIQWAIHKNLELYDLRGISGDMDPENPLYGLYRFKKGFSGEKTEFIGEVQMVFKPWVNRIVSMLLRLRKKRMRKWGTN